MNLAGPNSLGLASAELSTLCCAVHAPCAGSYRILFEKAPLPGTSSSSPRPTQHSFAYELWYPKRTLLTSSTSARPSAGTRCVAAWPETSWTLELHSLRSFALEVGRARHFSGTSARRTSTLARPQSSLSLTLRATSTDSAQLLSPLISQSKPRGNSGWTRDTYKLDSALMHPLDIVFLSLLMIDTRRFLFNAYPKRTRH